MQETAILARAGQAHINLHETDWVTAQQEVPVLKTMIKWICNQKVQDLKHLLGGDTYTEGRNYSPRVEEANALSRSPLSLPYTNRQVGISFAICSSHGSLSNCHEWMSLRCWTPALAMHTVFWQPGMAVQMQKVISNYKQCIWHEGNCAKAPV